MSDAVLLMGVVTGVRGLKGDLRIKTFTDDPMDLGGYNALTDADGSTVYRVKAVSVHKGQLIARMDGITDRTQAEALKGLELYVARKDLPQPEEEEFYYADLVGLRADLADGGTLGTVKAVQNYGAGDILEVSGDQGPILIPFTKEAVPEVDVAGGRVVIDPPDGLFEDPDEDGEEDGETTDDR